jgi:hypothetical protein
MHDRDTTGGFFRLHDMAAAFGDGLIPELYDLLTRPAPPVELSGNVIAFPSRQGQSQETRALRAPDDRLGSGN